MSTIIYRNESDWHQGAISNKEDPICPADCRVLFDQAEWCPRFIYCFVVLVEHIQVHAVVDDRDGAETPISGSIDLEPACLAFLELIDDLNRLKLAKVLRSECVILACVVSDSLRADSIVGDPVCRVRARCVQGFSNLSRVEAFVDGRVVAEEVVYRVLVETVQAFVVVLDGGDIIW